MSTTNGTTTAGDRRGNVTEQVGRFALLIILGLLLLLFSLAEPESFGTWDNFKSIASNEVVIVFLAFAATLPLIVGEFDLSVAAVFTWSQIIVVGLVIEHDWSVWAAIGVALASAVVIGLINGIAVVRFQINSFIATLASGSILTAASLAYTNGESIFGDAPTSLTNIARKELFGIDLPVFYALAFALVIALVLARLPIGRRMYATGGNQRAAQLTGIATHRYVVSTFVVSALLAAFGGIMLGSRVGAASTEVGGTLLIQAFAGAFLGATAFWPGRFNIPGTLVAVYVVGVAVTGLEQMGAALWVEPLFQGAVLFIAVGLSAWTARYRAGRARQARLRELEERRAHDPDAGGAPVGTPPVAGARG
jgi:ribose transport system permease protein